jgi:hypothetical protein
MVVGWGISVPVISDVFHETVLADIDAVYEAI